MKVSFLANIASTGKNTTGIPVPVSIVEHLAGGRKPKVIATINNYSYRNSVGMYSGQYMLSLSQENREAAGVTAGESVMVTLELDTLPRLVNVPEDLRLVLDSEPGAMDIFEHLSYTTRKEYVRQVEEAKSVETRLRRISKISNEIFNLLPEKRKL